MIYIFKCHCGFVREVELSIQSRDSIEVVCSECLSIMHRQLLLPQSSKLMGIKEATKRDGHGALIDERGSILEPLTRMKQ